MTRLSHILPAQAARPGVLGAVVLASVLAVTGCGAGSSSGSSSSGSSGSSSSSGSGTSRSSFRQCLQQHGVALPQGGPFGGGGGGGGGGTPRPRPTGSAASSFRQAIQACGGGGFPGGFGSSG